MNKTEEFIETVKKFEVLYDLKRLDYKDAVARNAAWQEISKIVNVPASTCRDNWKKLRNSYANALKRRRAKCIITTPWKFEKQLSFLKEHMQIRANCTQATNNLPSNDVQQQNPPENYDTAAITISTFDLSDGAESPRELRQTYDIIRLHNDPTLKKYQDDPNLDETDYFFLTISKSVKKLPLLDQTRIKLDTHRNVYHSENQYTATNPINYTSPLWNGNTPVHNIQFQEQNKLPMTKYYDPTIDPELQEIVQNPETLLL